LVRLKIKRAFEEIAKFDTNGYMEIKNGHKVGFSRVVTSVTENFGFSPALSLALVIFTSLVVCLAVFWFIHMAPPRVITITSGPAGSSFERNATNYAAILARSGVRLKVLPSEGSLENLQRLENPAVRVNIGFVQGGVASGANTDHLVSLGSIAYEPLLVFYRNVTPITLLSGFEGKRLAIGAMGSGSRLLAETLLQTNGIAPGGTTTFLDLGAEAAAKGLLAGTVDAVFLMSDSASSKTMQTLLRSPDIRLMNFEQADAYTRRFNYLNKMRLPKGSLDFGKNLPPQDIWLIGPTVELVARTDLNPALSDLLLEAAQEVHGHASMFQNQGEFPAPVQHEYKISADAARYYKSGKTFLYRSLPFWIASLLNRMLVVFIPTMLVLIPGLKLLPAMYKWRIRLRIHRWYRTLLRFEREIVQGMMPAQQEELHRRLDAIETAVKQLKVPASFADQFYGLRGHIDYVRARLAERKPAR
jgi:TRAP-type uncharacterized transport system substrate-binding protein